MGEAAAIRTSGRLLLFRPGLAGAVPGGADAVVMT